jgi:hypothetical protein
VTRARKNPLSENNLELNISGGIGTTLKCRVITVIQPRNSEGSTIDTGQVR